MTLTINDLVALRKLRSIAEAQVFLAHHDVHVSEWHKYIPLVATSIGAEGTDIELRAYDPLRHWCWALLVLNGASYRQIATYYGVATSTVHVGVGKYLTPQQRSVKLPKISLEFVQQLATAFALHRHELADTSINPFTTAQKLCDLTNQLGD